MFYADNDARSLVIEIPTVLCACQLVASHVHESASTTSHAIS
jgi:hypothetical protein